MPERRCAKCEELKDIVSFRKKRTGRYESYCRPCEKLYQEEYYQANKVHLTNQIREYRKANPEKTKRWQENFQKTRSYRSTRLKYKYGITQDDYDEMYKKQNGCFLICEKSKPLVVDHCHSSLVVRGLLCKTCNAAIGFFGESLIALQNAALYITKYIVPTTAETVKE